MPNPDDAVIDQYANLSGSGSPIPGVSRVGNSFTQTDQGPATRMSAGAIDGASAPVPVAQQGAMLKGDTDIYGNSTVATQKMQGELSRVQSSAGPSFAPSTGGVPGALDRLKGSQGATTVTNNMAAVRGSLPPDSPLYQAPSPAAQVAPPAGAPAVQSAPLAAPPATQQAGAQPDTPAAPPGAVDKPARSAPTQGDLDQAQALTGFAQRQMGLNGAPGSLLTQGNTGLAAIAGSAGIRNTLNTAQDLRQSGIQYGTVKGADGKDQVLISGTGGAPGDMIRGTAPAGPVDAYGNGTAQTTQAKAQLAQIAADNAATDEGNKKWRDSQQADAQDFRERERADAAARNIGWAASDVARGSGAVTDPRGRTHSAPGADGKIAALNALQQQDATARNSHAQSVAQRNAVAGEQGRQAVLSKGQQLQHDTAMAQVMGSPLHQQGQMLDNAIKAGTVNQAQALQGLNAQLIEAGKAGDANKQAQLALLIRQLSGKTAEDRFKGLSLGGGTNAMGEKEAASALLYDTQTGQAQHVTGGAQTPAPSQADLEHTAKKYNMTVEQVKARLQGAK